MVKGSFENMDNSAAVRSVVTKAWRMLVVKRRVYAERSAWANPDDSSRTIGVLQVGSCSSCHRFENSAVRRCKNIVSWRCISTSCLGPKRYEAHE